MVCGRAQFAILGRRTRGPKALIKLLAIASSAYCWTACQTRTSEGQVNLLPSVAGVAGTSSAATGPVVPLEVSGRLEAGTPATGPSVSDFRSRVALTGGRTLPLVGMGRPGTPSQAESSFDKEPEKLATMGPGERLVIEVTPVAFNEDSVTLDFRFYKLDETSGERKLLSEPRIVAPYDELSEIQQVDTAPDATISRLSLSVLPNRPRLASGDVPNAGLDEAASP